MEEDILFNEGSDFAQLMKKSGWLILSFN